MSGKCSATEGSEQCFIDPQNPLDEIADKPRQYDVVVADKVGWFRKHIGIILTIKEEDKGTLEVDQQQWLMNKNWQKKPSFLFPKRKIEKMSIGEFQTLLQELESDPKVLQIKVSRDPSEELMAEVNEARQYS